VQARKDAAFASDADARNQQLGLADDPKGTETTGNRSSITLTMAIGGAKLPDTQSVQTLLHIARCGAAISAAPHRHARTPPRHGPHAAQLGSADGHSEVARAALSTHAPSLVRDRGNSDGHIRRHSRATPSFRGGRS
jgi:hypothetical protein